MMEAKSCKTCIRYSEYPETENPACRHCDDLNLHVRVTDYSEENEDEIRMNQIGQNGNTGEHYSHVMSAPPEIKKARIIPVEVHAYDEADDLMFILKAEDEFCVAVEWRTIVAKSNIDHCIQVLRDAVEMMQLEG